MDKNKALRKYLQDEFDKRKQSNAQYSLRSFAKSLDIDPGSLCHFLRGNRKFSFQKVKELAMKLNLSDAEILDILSLQEVAEKLKSGKDPRFTYEDGLEKLSILECLRLDDFQQDAKWIATHLGLSEESVKENLETLFADNYIVVGKDATWRVNYSRMEENTNSATNTTDKRKLEKDLIDKCRSSMNDKTEEISSSLGFVSAIDSSLKIEIEKEMEDFRHRIAKIIESKSRKRDEVYCLQLNWFPHKN